MAIARTTTNIAKAGLITSASVSGAGVLSYIAGAAGATSIIEGLGSVVAFGEGLPIIGSLSTSITSGVMALGNSLAGVLGGTQVATSAVAMKALLAASPFMAAGLGIALIGVGVLAVWGVSKLLNRLGDKGDAKIQEMKERSQEQSLAKQQSQERGQAPSQSQHQEQGPSHAPMQDKSLNLLPEHQLAENAQNSFYNENHPAYGKSESYHRDRHAPGRATGVERGAPGF